MLASLQHFRVIRTNILSKCRTCVGFFLNIDRKHDIFKVNICAASRSAARFATCSFACCANPERCSCTVSAKLSKRVASRVACRVTSRVQNLRILPPAPPPRCRCYIIVDTPVGEFCHEKEITVMRKKLKYLTSCCHDVLKPYLHVPYRFHHPTRS